MSRETQSELHLNTRRMHSPCADLLAPRRPAVCPDHDALLRLKSCFTTVHWQRFAMLLETLSLSLCSCFKGRLLVFAWVDCEVLTLSRAVWMLMLSFIALIKVSPSSVCRSHLGMLCSWMERQPLTSSRAIHELSQHSQDDRRSLI